MDVWVQVKRVLDYGVKARAKSDYRGMDTANVKMRRNHFVETAVEEAVGLEERGVAAGDIAVSESADGGIHVNR